jgi:hypothetical protein
MSVRYLPPSVAALVLCVAFVAAGERPARTKPNYYPIEPGNQWTFRLEANGKEVTLVNRIAKIETINGTAMGRLEATIDGKIVATEHLEQNAKGVFRHRNNGQEVEPALMLLRYPLKADDKWEGELKVGDEKAKYTADTAEEEVTVAAGKFKTKRVAIKLNQDGKTVDTTYWFANNVGIVKQTVDVGGLSVVVELQKFEKKK